MKPKPKAYEKANAKAAFKRTTTPGKPLMPVLKRTTVAVKRGK